jgi:hypothetical protein
MCITHSLQLLLRLHLSSTGTPLGLATLLLHVLLHVLLLLQRSDLLLVQLLLLLAQHRCR